MRRHVLSFCLASALIFLSLFGSNFVTSAAEEPTALLSTELPQSPELGTKPLVSSQTGTESLSARALAVAKITGILPLFSCLRSEQQNAKSFNRVIRQLFANTGDLSVKEAGVEHPGTTEKMLQALVITQRIVYLRSEIGQYLQTTNLELNAVLGRLNSAMAGLADTKAIIADERARILRRNSFINLISGGLTKIGGYSSALTPASLIPTNILEVFDGGVQTSLSVLTLREQRNESKLYRSKPDILTSFINSQNEENLDYPASVWTYLNQADPSDKAKKTRRQVLIEYWLRAGRLSDSTGLKGNSSSNYQPTFGKARINKMDDIDDSVAMMSDLKSAVSQMENSLMELSQVIKDSYKNDPEI